MRPYTQLTLEQRYQIQALLKTGDRYTEIARVLGVHASTISREVRRNQGCRGYHRPQQAHRITLARRHTKARRRIPMETWHRVDRLLQEEWSPEQISGWLRTWQGSSVSHEWIYQHVLHDKWAQGTLYRHLRCQRHRPSAMGPTVVGANSATGCPSRNVRPSWPAAPGSAIGKWIR